MGILDMRASTLKFEEMGRWYTGTVTAEPEESQRSEYQKGGGGQPLFWLNNKPTPGASHDPRTGQPNEPVMQTEITVDVGTPDDYGSTERVLYIDNKRKIAALRAAWRAAGMPRGASMIGCSIAARWSGTEPGEGTQEAKLYEYRIKAPAGGVKMRAAAPEPAPAPPAASTAPASFDNGPGPFDNPPAADDRGPFAGTRTTFALACPDGVQPQQWAAMTPAQRSQMYQALGLTIPVPAGARSSDPFLDNEPPF